MDPRILSHNTHLEDVDKFLELDPELRSLSTSQYVFVSPQLQRFPKVSSPGIYALTGAYQTGKTILLKQWMKKLLTEGVPANRIAFIPAATINNYHELYTLVKNQLEQMPVNETPILIIDEITTIHDWKKAITQLMSENKPERLVLMLSGSVASLEWKELSGHIHLYPLSFRETIELKFGSELPPLSTLFTEFEAYLKHGGFLKAINELAKDNMISVQTLRNYHEWIVKEVVKHGKHEHYLHEIITAIVKNYNKQITWNALAQEVSIDHPKTIGDYFQLLELLDVVFVQYALLEDSLLPAPKKARKVMFTSPFLYHVAKHWLASQKSSANEQIDTTLEDPVMTSKLVETSVITELRKFYPTYYIKAEGEVDLAYLFDHRFWPIEISWSSQMRAKDLKQILKYPNGRILTKTDRSGIIEHIRTEPLPIALWQLEEPHTIKVQGEGYAGNE